MAFKFIAFATLVAAASAGYVSVAPQAYNVAHAVPLAYAHAAPLAYAAPVAKIVTKSYEPEPADSHPQYSYSYGVHDSLTGDVKNQQETRNGDAVEGSYSFIEADGSRRTVEYTADDHNGFNAVVKNEPAQVAVESVVVKSPEPVVVKTVAPIAYQAAPVLKYAAPLAYTSYSAPLAQQWAAPLAQEWAAPAYAYDY